MKTENTPSLAQIEALANLLDGAEVNDSLLQAHLKALSQLADYFIDRLCEEKKEEQEEIVECIQMIGYLKKDLKDFLKN